MTLEARDMGTIKENLDWANVRRGEKDMRLNGKRNGTGGSENHIVNLLPQ